MTDDDDTDGFVLSTGREIYAHMGIIGIAPDLKIYEGYDGHIDERSELTEEDLLELADLAIDRWRRFKEAVVASRAREV